MTATLAQFVHFQAFLARGLVLREEEIAFGEVAPGVTVMLTRSLDLHCRDADRARAMLPLLDFGLKGLDERIGRLDELADEVAKRRQREYNDGPYLLVLRSGSVAFRDEGRARDFPNLSVGFNVVDWTAVTGRGTASALIGVALSLPGLVSLKEIVNSSVAYRPDGMPFFAYTFEAGTARVTINQPVERDELDAVPGLTLALMKQPELERVQRLLLRAVLNDSDRLRGFLTAWTALEIFVNKVFPTYRQTVYERLVDAQPPALADYVKRLECVMEGRHNLRDKFSVIAVSLDAREAAPDIAEFARIKKIRDKFAHGEDVSEDLLPVEETSSLLRKYMRLHLERSRHRRDTAPPN